MKGTGGSARAGSPVSVCATLVVEVDRRERNRLAKQREYADPARREIIKARSRERSRRPEVKARRKERDDARRKTDAFRAYRTTYITAWVRRKPERRIEWALRSRLRALVSGRYRSAGATELVGCSWADMRWHIESQFRPGMSWDNYGPNGWHIDHIRPCASFDLTDPDQQRQCFHYSNLQPLFAHENLAKSDRLDWVHPDASSNKGE